MTSRRRDTYEIKRKFERALAHAVQASVDILPDNIDAGPGSPLVEGYNACLQLVKCEDGHISFVIPKEVSRDLLIKALQVEFDDLPLDKKRDFKPAVLTLDDTMLHLPHNARCFAISLDLFPEVQPAATRGGR